MPSTPASQPAARAHPPHPRAAYNTPPAPISPNQPISLAFDLYAFERHNPYKNRTERRPAGRTLTFETGDMVHTVLAVVVAKLTCRLPEPGLTLRLPATIAVLQRVRAYQTDEAPWAGNHKT